MQDVERLAILGWNFGIASNPIFYSGYNVVVLSIQK